MIIAEDLFLVHLRGSEKTLRKKMANEISSDNLDVLLKLSSQFLEIAERTFDYDVAFERVNKKNVGVQKIFKMLFCELIDFLENSDICGNCENRLLLEDLCQTKELVFYCENCCILVNSPVW